MRKTASSRRYLRDDVMRHPDASSPIEAIERDAKLPVTSGRVVRFLDDRSSLRRGACSAAANARARVLDADRGAARCRGGASATSTARRRARAAPRARVRRVACRRARAAPRARVRRVACARDATPPRARAVRSRRAASAVRSSFAPSRRSAHATRLHRSTVVRSRSGSERAISNRLLRTNDSYSHNPICDTLT
jgi:hypothetical protein